MNQKKAAIVLAAGKGTRMKSDLPKVLHPINGRPMIAILLDSLMELNFEQIVVVIGYKGELVEEALAGYPVKFAWQKEQLGTGHAVIMTKEMMGDFDGTTLIALGDVPFLRTETIKGLFDIHDKTGAKATCLSAILDDPKGYGRIIREDNSDVLKGIVEHKDADEATLKIKEINTGTFCFDNQWLFKTLDMINNDNSQGEYYLTDCVKILYNKGLRVTVTALENSDEGLGVNSVEQLEKLALKFVTKG